MSLNLYKYPLEMQKSRFKKTPADFRDKAQKRKPYKSNLIPCAKGTSLLKLMVLVCRRI